MKWKSLAAGAILAASLAVSGCSEKSQFSLVDDNGSGKVAGSQSSLFSAFRGNTPPVGDKIERAKKQFRARNFGLAEQEFRAIVEKEPGNAEAWLGLAASYDQLRRFDLADRAYGQVARLAGPSVALHNNRGYSYLLRGNERRARSEFRKAQQLDPKNAFVRNNMKMAGVR